MSPGSSEAGLQSEESTLFAELWILLPDESQELEEAWLFSSENVFNDPKVQREARASDGLPSPFLGRLCSHVSFRCGVDSKVDLGQCPENVQRGSRQTHKIQKQAEEKCYFFPDHTVL